MNPVQMCKTISSLITECSLAVNDDGTILGLRVHVHHLSDSPPELEERVAEWIAVARPLRVVELDHLPLLTVLAQPDRPEKSQFGRSEH